MKIHPVVNMSRIVLYQEQVEGQKKILPPLVEINREKEYEIEKILNRQDVREKLKYLVRWKEYMAEEDTWEELENQGNAIELVEEFEIEIREEEIRKVQMRKEKEKEKGLNIEAEIFKRSELLEKYTVKIIDSGLYFIFSFHFYFTLLYFSFSFSIFRTARVRVYQSRCHISHKLMAQSQD